MEQSNDSEWSGVAHAYLNALHAGLQGRYTRMNILKQLDSSYRDDAGLIETAARLNKVIELYKALWSMNPINMRADKLCSNASLVVQLQGEMIVEYEKLACCITPLNKISPEAMERAELIELVAYVAEQAYGREHYIRGLVSYGEVFQLPNVADRWRQHLLSCQKEIHEANTFFSMIKQDAASVEEIARAVKESSLLLPGIFRCKKVDLQVLPWVETGNATFEDLQLLPFEAKGWEALGIAPVGAAYWQAYGFSPEMAGTWIHAQFLDPSYAASWMCREFDPEEAVRWIAARVSAKRARSLVLAGVNDPDSLTLAESIVD